jgi:hypothetical protein
MIPQSDRLASLFRLRDEAHPLRGRWRQVLLISAALFLLASGVRLLSGHDARLEVAKVQTEVTKGYKRVARLLLEGGAASFFDPSSPLADLDTMGHPPGYSVLLALIFRLCGESDTAVQLMQIIADALCAVVIFLLASELLPRGVAVISGALVALAPQFTWNSVVILPDTLAVAPILLAVYLIVRAARARHQLATLFVAGVLVGLSCWLRANAMLLVVFLAVLMPVLFERGRRAGPAIALVLGAVFVIAPLTIRNWRVFGRFIPISLGAGQTLLEGIADYDPEGRFGIPATDLGIIRQEAAAHDRPDWAASLFGPEGIERERMRLSRGFGVIRSHPFWFAGVMTRRAASMLRLERARLIAPDPPVTHPFDNLEEMQPAWQSAPAQLLGEGTARSTSVSLTPDGQALRLTGDDSRYGEQFVSHAFAISRNTDYVLTIETKIEVGRMKFDVAGADSGVLYASEIVETREGLTPEEQPERTIRIPFVSRGSDERVQLRMSNAASLPARPSVRIGAVRLYALGEASYVWTRPPRLFFRGLQKLFITAVMLPLALAGLALLAAAGKWRALSVLLIVPAYYFCVQSALHTEYRYVLAIHHFLFVAVAAALYCAGLSLWGRFRRGTEARK